MNNILDLSSSFDFNNNNVVKGEIEIDDVFELENNIEILIQDKIIEPTREIQTVTADEDYDQLGTVTVNPIPDEYIIPDGTLDVDANGDVDVTMFRMARVGVYTPPTLQDKEVTPTKEEQIISCDEDYDGLNEVKVNPIPSEYIIPNGTLNITENGNKDVTHYTNVDVNIHPQLQDKTIKITENGTQTITSDEGYDALNSIEITTNVVEDLTAEVTVQNEEITEQEVSINNIIQALQGKATPEKVNLQDKTIEINDEYILDITADDGFDGLGMITIIVNTNKYAEYQMLEYIKGTSYVTGSNYFKTGIYPTNKTTLEMQYAFYKNNNNYSNLYGSSRQFLAQSTTANDTRVVALWNGELIGGMSSLSDFNKHIIKQDKNKMYFDGVLKQTCTPADWVDENELKLFGLTGGQDASAILYYCKIWEDDVLVRDFVPCYRKSDGLIGILDKVECKFYENAGTVPFEKGPNI